MLSINVTTHGVCSLFRVAMKSPSTPTSTTTVNHPVSQRYPHRPPPLILVQREMVLHVPRPISRTHPPLCKIIHPPTSTTTVNHPASRRHQHLPRQGLVPLWKVGLEDCQALLQYRIGVLLKGSFHKGEDFCCRVLENTTGVVLWKGTFAYSVGATFVGIDCLLFW